MGIDFSLFNEKYDDRDIIRLLDKWFQRAGTNESLYLIMIPHLNYNVLSFVYLTLLLCMIHGLMILKLNKFNLFNYATNRE